MKTIYNNPILAKFMSGKPICCHISQGGPIYTYCPESKTMKDERRVFDVELAVHGLYLVSNGYRWFYWYDKLIMISG